MKNKIVIVDGNNQLYRAHFSHLNLDYKGKLVSAIYGMPQIISSVIKRLKPHYFFICWDGKKHPRRLELCPEYKAKRKNFGVDWEQIIRQKPICMRLFKLLGISQVWSMGMEADDYIYALVRKYKRDPDNEIVIVSTDKDFHQLLCRNVKIWDDKKKVLLTRNNLIKYYPYTPKQCVDYLILNGDDSDNIKGYKGMGEKRIPAFLELFSSIEYFLKSKKEHKGIDKKKLAELYLINNELINLKLFYEKNIKGKVEIEYYKNLRNPKPNKLKFRRLCAKYGIKTFLKTDFINTFKMRTHE